MKIYKDKIAIVTGAGAGIGKSLSLELAKHEAIVIAIGRNTENVENTVTEIQSSGGRAIAIKLDVSVEEDVKKVIDAIYHKHGRIDYLFNIAGISIAGEMRDLSIEDFKKVVEINLMGVIYGTYSAYQIMINQGFGHIVNMSSLAGLLPFPAKTPYATTKHAIVGLTSTLRHEAAALGVKVSLVCPGLVETDIWKNTPIKKINKELAVDYVKENFFTKIIKKQMATPETSAKLILKGVARNKAILTFPFHARLCWLIYRLSPILMTPFGRKMIKDFRNFRY